MSVASKCLFFSLSHTLPLPFSRIPYLAYSLSTHAVFTFALRHFRFRCNGDVAIAPSQLPQGVASIKRKPSTVILRLLRIATPEREMAYAEMDGLQDLLLAAAVFVVVVVVFARLPHKSNYKLQSDAMLLVRFSCAP